MMSAAANGTAGLVSLLVFVALFAAVVILLLRRGAREDADRHALIPFKESGSHD